MSFSLNNVPSTFQRAVAPILSTVKGKSAFVYLKDVAMFLRSVKEQLDYLWTVLGLLSRAGELLKLKICFLVNDIINFWGAILPARPSISLKATKTIHGLQYPTDRTKTNLILGLCNIFRRFVQKFACKAAQVN